MRGCRKGKRRERNRMNHRKMYQDMEDHAPDPRAAERFRRKPYKLPSKISTEEKGAGK